MEENYIRPTEDELIEQEEKCRKALKTILRAIAMRIFVTVLLLWVLVRSGAQAWVIGMLVLVSVINLSGILPLWSELKKQRTNLKTIMDQYE